MNRNIRESRSSDMAEIMKVMDAARKIMRQSGNIHQGEKATRQRMSLSATWISMAVLLLRTEVVL